MTLSSLLTTSTSTSRVFALTVYVTLNNDRRESRQQGIDPAMPKDRGGDERGRREGEEEGGAVH
jgi:hypothetical protein